MKVRPVGMLLLMPAGRINRHQQDVIDYLKITWRRRLRPACHCWAGGSLDSRGSDQTRVAEKQYQDLGGQIAIIGKERDGRCLAASKATQPIVDFIVGHAK